MPSKISAQTQTAYDWVDTHTTTLSGWHQQIFDFAETAWREYRSSAWYVERLQAEGFTVEAGSAGMPTAFCANWENGKGGPTIAGYAECDAVPGNCQAADVEEKPRSGLSKHAGGHTDPHSALGIGSLAGFLAAKAAMEKHNIAGRLTFFGEPAEKQRASKPIHAAGCGWSMNESITLAGQATADNLPAQISQIHYIMRVPTIEMAERIVQGLDKNAEAAASTSHCNWKKDWIAKAQQIQKNLGIEPMEKPFLADAEQLISPQEAESILRKELPEWQKNFTSDDYTEYCWHAPTVRLYIGRPMLKAPADGRKYPAWVMNALGGIAQTIDPMIFCAGKTIAGTVLDLMTQPATLAKAQDEFKQRTGGGIGGSQWLAPLCDYPAPIHFRWPEYIQTERGHEWWIPTPPETN
jgi:metal-dependent amidase/aminoacylase/carboxypeptidase family protein